MGDINMRAIYINKSSVESPYDDLFLKSAIARRVRDNVFYWTVLRYFIVDCVFLWIDTINWQIAAYMGQWTGSLLDRVMTATYIRALISGAKPLLQWIVTYWPLEQISMNFESI